MFHLIEVIGTMAFAMSGALTAMHKKLDPFGIFIIAFATAVGGGTLRDIMIGRTPVGWMLDVNYVHVIVVGFILAIIFRKKFDRLRTSLFLFDTIGLGVFYLDRSRKRHQHWFASHYLHCIGNHDCLFWRRDSRYFVHGNPGYLQGRNLCHNLHSWWNRVFYVAGIKFGCRCFVSYNLSIHHFGSIDGGEIQMVFASV